MPSNIVLEDQREDSASNKRALENFVTGNRDLAELEALASRFNIFEALGVVNAELRHSSFLAFLLNPRESHSLKDLVLKRLLQETLQANPEVTSLTPIEIDVNDFSDCEVQTEIDNIDILLKCTRHRLLIIIENKINSDQHDDQLARYYRQTREKYPHLSILGIYLTRFADPSGNSNYVSLSHTSISKIVLEVMSLPRVILGRDVEHALRQYTEMLGRHFMADENIKELCMKIYLHHKQAIDLIIENLPNRRDEIAKELRSLLAREGFLIDDEKVQTIRFIPPALDIEFFRGGSGWTKSGRMLLFEFINTQNSLHVGIILGPGEDSKRSRIFREAQRLGKPFTAGSTMYAKWNSLYKRVILELDDYKLPTEDLLAKVKSVWQSILAEDFPQITQKLAEVRWETSN
jgi:hypothetical protein